MLYIVAAKLFDPVLIVLGLAVGRLSPSVRIAAIWTAVVALGGEWLVTDGYPRMGTFLLGLACAACWTGLGQYWRNYKRLKLIGTLTRMANWMEAIERTRYSQPIGAGGEIKSLPEYQQAQAISDFEAGVKYIEQFPRHVVTEEVIRERQIARRLGQDLRAEVIATLLDRLIDQNLAMEPEDFAKLHAGAQRGGAPGAAERSI